MAGQSFARPDLLRISRMKNKEFTSRTMALLEQKQQHLPQRLLYIVVTFL
jgi:hypothetical protein